MVVLIFILLTSVNSFLLDNPQGNGGTATTNQYLTLSKFYEEMKLQQQDTTKLRHDTDNSLTLLTSQLQQKFDLLDKKFAEIERQNETIPDSANMDQKYKQLEQMYLNLEHSFNTLKVENNLLQNKKEEMEHTLFSLQNETYHQGKELAVLKTKSLIVDQKIENLKKLGSIKPLQELQTLQQEVKLLSAKTSSLNMKEQARSQDFIALYSKVQDQGANSTRSITNLNLQMKTLQSNHNTSIRDLGDQMNILQTNHNISIRDLIAQMNILQTNHNISIRDLIAQMNILQTNHNSSITDLGTELKRFHKNQSTVFANIESKLSEAFLRDNQTFIQLQRQIDTVYTELVVMTAHPSASKTKSGIIKFDDVKFSVGINNLSMYKTTGKFVVEKEGLYLISPSIRSDSNDAFYYIYLNGNPISITLLNYNSNSPTMQNSGTIVLALQLRPNDSVWIYYKNNFHIEGGMWSTLTIVKLK